MKKALLYFLPLILLVSCSKSPDTFVQVSQEYPRYFQLSDGSTFIPVGPNICFDRFHEDEETVLSLYEDMFRKLSENGGNYTRIWIGYPFFELERYAVGEYDETSIKRLDRLVESARKYGIRLKFCIEYFRNIVDPAVYDITPPFFEKPLYGTYFKDMDEYCKTEKGQEVFLSKMRFLASRYADDPIFFGWELWNEVNNLAVSNYIDGSIDWTRLMLPKVQELFPKHLVMQNLGSFDTESYRDWYYPVMTMEDNDVAQVHRYLDEGARWDICQASIDTLASEAVKEILEMVEDKPVVLAEAGAVKPGHTGPSLLYPKDTEGVLLHDFIFAPFFSGSAATGQNWHWDTYIYKNDLWWHYQRFVNAIDGVDPVKERFTPSLIVQDDVRYYCLNGKNVTLIWARDKRSNWRTELVDGVAPEERTVTLGFEEIMPGFKSVTQYDPWADTTKELTAEGSFSFTRSTVIRLCK